MPEVVVSIGPHHPALKEPVNFKVIARGKDRTPRA
jgi:Ni,Fe-hydrogenase III large subunit